MAEVRNTDKPNSTSSVNDMGELQQTDPWEGGQVPSTPTATQPMYPTMDHNSEGTDTVGPRG